MSQGIKDFSYGLFHAEHIMMLDHRRPREQHSLERKERKLLEAKGTALT
jgi:hypothetical protein